MISFVKKVISWTSKVRSIRANKRIFKGCWYKDKTICVIFCLFRYDHPAIVVKFGLSMVGTSVSIWFLIVVPIFELHVLRRVFALSKCWLELLIWQLWCHRWWNFMNYYCPAFVHMFQLNAIKFPVPCHGLAGWFYIYS